LNEVEGEIYVATCLKGLRTVDAHRRAAYAGLLIRHYAGGNADDCSAEIFGARWQRERPTACRVEGAAGRQWGHSGERPARRVGESGHDAAGPQRPAATEHFAAQSAQPGQPAAETERDGGAGQTGSRGLGYRQRSEHPDLPGRDQGAGHGRPVRAISLQLDGLGSCEHRLRGRILLDTRERSRQLQSDLCRRHGPSRPSSAGAPRARGPARKLHGHDSGHAIETDSRSRGTRQWGRDGCAECSNSGSARTVECSCTDLRAAPAGRHYQCGDRLYPAGDGQHECGR
jgi:hypothetical protein